MNGTQPVETIVDHVAELLRQRIGLRAEPTLRGRLRRAVRDEAALRGQDLTGYLDALVSVDDALQGLLNRVTVQETAFFRHPQHFEVLAREVLPTLARPVRIWSAGCANGQEAFSLAMLLEEQGIDGSVTGTDLSTAAVGRTAAARYTSRELFGLSPERVASHLSRTGETWQVNQPIRDRVSTLRHNLLDPLPPEVLSCQVVFCRNVLIYLSPEHAHAFLHRIADSLPASSLFLGAAETIWPICDRFKAIAVTGTFLYRQPVSPTSAAETPTENQPSSADRARSKSIPGTRAARVIARDQSTPGPSEAATGSQPRTLDAAGTAALLTKQAQEAMAARAYDEAVIGFRKCAYLTPHDPLAQLHLGLALEAAGHEHAAQRAYAAARRASTEADASGDGAGIDGIARADLLRLLDFKQRVLSQ